MAHAGRNTRADERNPPPVRRARDRDPDAAKESTHGTARSESLWPARRAEKTADKPDSPTGSPKHRVRRERAPCLQGSWPRQSEGLTIPECDRRQEPRIHHAQFSRRAVQLSRRTPRSLV